ncbi:MAG: hypothetical protein B7Z37_29575 [Verrucomicrobia bacterium 12-59-8]|nr:MAG: hypothetical protein B7Z37_29575 [Verrucomicrobia bacterium 12-59-8]
MRFLVIAQHTEQAAQHAAGDHGMLCLQELHRLMDHFFAGFEGDTGPGLVQLRKGELLLHDRLEQSIGEETKLAVGGLFAVFVAGGMAQAADEAGEDEVFQRLRLQRRIRRIRIEDAVRTFTPQAREEVGFARATGTAHKTDLAAMLCAYLIHHDAQRAERPGIDVGHVQECC